MSNEQVSFPWMNVRLGKGNLLIYMVEVSHHCRRNLRHTTSVQKCKGWNWGRQLSANSRSQIKHESDHSSTTAFLLGDYKFTTSFGTLLTDSQVKKTTLSCMRSEMTGTTVFNKIVYDTHSTTGWFNTNDVMFFNTHRANFLAEVMLFITSLFPENVSCLASKNSLEQSAATTVLETTSVDKRNL